MVIYSQLKEEPAWILMIFVQVPASTERMFRYQQYCTNDIGKSSLVLIYPKKSRNILKTHNPFSSALDVSNYLNPLKSQQEPQKETINLHCSTARVQLNCTERNICKSLFPASLEGITVCLTHHSRDCQTVYVKKTVFKIAVYLLANKSPRQKEHSTDI